MEKQKDMKEKMAKWILTLELVGVLTEEEKQKALERLEEIYPSSETP